MANRWERGKLGPYTIPSDFTTGGVKIAGINNIKGSSPKFLVPAGTIFYAASYNVATITGYPNYYAAISGQEVSRTTYTELFSTIGTLFGSGNGSTTFNLPTSFNLYARCHGPTTSGINQLQPSVVPDHTHISPSMSGVTLSGATSGRGENLNLNFPTLSADTYYLGTEILKNANREKASVTPNGVTSTTLNLYNARGARTSTEYRLASYITLDDTDLPVGSIIPFIGNDSASGIGNNWSLCDGTNGTPDLRAAFISNVGNPLGVFSVTGFGATYSQNVPMHSHLQTISGSSVVHSIYPSGNYFCGFRPNSGGTGINTPVTVNTSSAGVGPALESRPANISVNYFQRAT
jgi:microcystin-dependent protein